MVDAPGRIDTIASTGRRLWLVYWGWNSEGPPNDRCFFEVIQTTDFEAHNLQRLLDAGERAHLVWDPWLTPLIAEKATRYEAFGYRTLRDFAFTSGIAQGIALMDRTNGTNRMYRTRTLAPKAQSNVMSKISDTHRPEVRPARQTRAWRQGAIHYIRSGMS